MKNESFKLSEQTTFHGRNGTFKCVGINMLLIEGLVDIRPETSRHDIGRCRITIPVKDIPAFIKTMKKMQPKPVKTVREHIFSPATDECILCGVSCQDAAIANERCIKRVIGS